MGIYYVVLRQHLHHTSPFMKRRDARRRGGRHTDFFLPSFFLVYLLLYRASEREKPNLPNLI